MIKEQPQSSAVDLEAVLDSIYSLIVEVRSFQLQVYERGQPFEASEVVGELVDLISRACAAISDLCHLTPTSAGPFVASLTPRKLEDLTDVCFVLRSDLRACGRRLGRLGEGKLDPQAVLIALERARAKTINGLWALDVRLSAISGATPRTQHIDVARRSLAARRLVAKLKSRLPDSGDFENDLESSLCRSGTVLVWLLGHSTFSSLGPEDRLMTRQLREMILNWLRGDRDQRTGRQIWHELQVFSELLRRMARHPALVEHDQQVLERAIQQLGSGEAGADSEQLMAEILDPLLGLDETLDNLLRQGAARTLVIAKLIEIEQSMASVTSLAVDTEADRPKVLPARNLRLV